MSEAKQMSPAQAAWPASAGQAADEQQLLNLADIAAGGQQRPQAREAHARGNAEQHAVRIAPYRVKTRLSRAR